MFVIKSQHIQGSTLGDFEPRQQGCLVTLWVELVKNPHSNQRSQLGAFFSWGYSIYNWPISWVLYVIPSEPISGSPKTTMAWYVHVTVHWVALAWRCLPGKPVMRVIWGHNLGPVISWLFHVAYKAYKPIFLMDPWPPPEKVRLNPQRRYSWVHFTVDMLSINDSEARHKATYRLGFGPHCRYPMDLLWIYSFWYKIKGWKMIG